MAQSGRRSAIAQNTRFVLCVLQRFKRFKGSSTRDTVLLPKEAKASELPATVPEND